MPVLRPRHERPYARRRRDWLKMKNPHAPAGRREAEEDWGRGEVAMTADQLRGLYTFIAAIAGGAIAFLLVWWFG